MCSGLNGSTDYTQELKTALYQIANVVSYIKHPLNLQCLNVLREEMW
jgi:hypothetical protein